MDGRQPGAGNSIEFSWEILRSILEGSSPIDLPALALSTQEEAADFLRHYGYNLDQPEDEELAWKIHLEAVAFVKRLLTSRQPEDPPEPLEIPAEIERPNDLRDLLVWASTHQGTPRQLWACTVLRVMHTISHVNNTMPSELFPEIKRQVLDRFRRHVHTDPEGGTTLGRGSLAVPLDGIYFKEEKSRDSLILKLLTKPNHTAEGIYDRLGVKIVTPSKMDALRVVRYLREHHLIVFANVTPGRSRNTLIDLSDFRRLHEELTRTTAGGPVEGSDLDFLEQLRARSESMDSWSGSLSNPFTSPAYRSIQFTVQQTVQVEDPRIWKARRLRLHLDAFHLGPELEDLLKDLEGPQRDTRRRVSFPMEIQLLDRVNYRLSLDGAASHSEYKLRQLRAARRRVLGGLLASRSAG